MGVVKGSKNVKINGTVKGSNSVRVDTARVNAQNATIRREYEDALKRINDYQGRIKDRKYLSGSDLDDMKSAIDTFEARGNTIRSLNSLGGYKYSDDENKAWEDSISSLRSGYGSAKDLYSPFKTEDEFNKGMKDARIHTEKMAVNVSESRKKLEEAKTMAAEAAKLLEQKNKALLPNEKNNLQRQFEDLDYKVNYITGGRSLDEYASYLDDVEKYQKKSNLLDFVSGLKNVENLIDVGKKESGGKLPTTGDLLVDDATGNGLFTNIVRDEYKRSAISEEEENNYYALLGYDKKNGTDYAKKYWDLFTEDFVSRKALNMAEKVADNGALVALFSVVAGADNLGEGFRGVGDWLSGSTEKKDPTSVQMASADIREKQNWFGRTMYDLGVNLSQQAPSTMLSFIPVIGTGASLATMGASAAGNAYNDAINSGMSVAEARSYSALVGGAEVVLGKLLDTTIKGGGALTKKITAMIPTADKAFANIAKTQIGIMASEFTEESLQTLLEPVFEGIATREDIDWSDTSAGDVLYSGLLGALSAFLLGNIDASTENTAANLAIRAIRNRSTGAGISNVDGAVARLAEAGSLMSADSVAYKVAQKVNQKIKNGDKVGAYTVGKLFYAENAYLTDQNKADIVKSLTRKGVAEADARTISEWMSAVVNGAELNQNQQTALEDNPDLIQTYADVILNPNSTVNQRMDTSAVKEVASAVVNGKKALSQSEGAKSEVPTAKSVEASKSATTEENEAQRKISASDGGVVAESTLDMSDFGKAQMRAAYDTLKNSPDSRVNGMSQDTFYRLFQSDYLDAYLGDSYETILSKPSLLPESVRATAYEIGRARAEARKADAKKRQAAIDEKKSEGVAKNATTTIGNGSVRFEVGAEAKTTSQKRAVSLAKHLSKALGIDIVFYDARTKTEDEDGYEENGYFDPKTNSIHLDLQHSEDDAKTIAFTLSHELVHFIKAWSPQKFEVLADFLVEQYGTDKAKMLRDKVKETGLDEDGAFEEMVADACETMLLDSNAVEKLMQLKARDLTLFEKIKAHIRNLLNKIRAEYKRLGLKPTSPEANALLKIEGALEKMASLFEDAAVDAAQNYQAVESLETDSVSVTEDGTIRMQMKQYQQTGRATLLRYLVGQYGNKTANDLIATIDNIYDVLTEVKQNEALSVFSNWQDTEVELDENGHPIFTTSVNNGDYELNQDFSRVCKKRRQLDFVLNMLAEDPAFEASNLTKQDFVKINKAIKKHGFEIACALCFVDSKRFRQAEWADSFANTWNDILNAVVKDSSKLTPFNFATKNPNLADDRIEIDTSKSVMYRKWSDGKEDVKNRRTYESLDQMLSKDSDGKWLEGNTNVRTIATLIRDNPELRHTFRGADIIGSQGFDTIQRLAPKIRNILDGWGGSSVPKPSSNDASYDSSIINMSKYNKETAYAMGGVRMNSFSDFMAHMFFDYCQAFADLSAKELPSQAYTKELDYVRLFGRSGQKQNMSGIAAIRDNALPTTAGKNVSKAEAEANEKIEKMIAGLDVSRLLEHLNKDIYQLTESDVEQFLDMCDYVWADESINMKHATLLQTGILYDKLSESKIEECYELLKAGKVEQALKVAGEENVDREYAKHCGTIVVGVSDAHIRKLLRDPTIRMVIPYHKSGLNPVIARELRIAAYNDYTLAQTTGVKRKGTKTSEKIGSTAIKDAYGLKDFAFYDWFGKTIDGKLYDGKATADKYLEWCEKGYYDENVGDYVYYTTKGDGYILASEFHKRASIIPKFDAFATEENYYKLLEDFDCYDTITGEHSAQGAVDFLRNGLPSDYKDVLVRALKAEQKVSDDFKEHLDNKGLKDEIMDVVKAHGYTPSDMSNTLDNIVDAVGEENIAEATELYTDVENTTRIKKQKKKNSDNTYDAIGKELLYYEEGDLAPDLTLVETVNDRTGNKEVTIKHYGQKPKNYVPKKIAYCYKLFEQHPDGSLHALFAGAKNAVPIGEWRYAQGFPRTDEGVSGMNLRERYGWHLSAGLPSAPHLMSSKYFDRGYPSKGAYGHPKGSKRVWVRMAYDASTDFNAVADSTGRQNDIYGLIPFGGYYAFKENNQSEWVISSAVKIDKILTEEERQQILKDAGYDEHEAWRLKYQPTPEERTARELANKERAKAKARAKKLGIDSELSESTKAMRDAIKSRIIDNPELTDGIKKQVKKTSDKDYLDAVDRGDMETAQRMVDEAAREAGYTPEHLFHGTSAFGFTEINVKNSDDGMSFFVSDKEEVAQGYFPYYETEYDDYHDSVRRIGKKSERPRVPLSQTSSVESVIERIKDAYPEYKNARRATESDILADLGDYWLPEAVSSAKELQNYSIPSNVRELVDLVVDASVDGTYDAWKNVSDRYSEFEDIYDILYNGMYWTQATSLWHKVQMGIQMASEIIGKDAVVNDGKVESKNVLINKYNDFLAGESNGIYDLYANHHNQLVIRGSGSNWNNIPLGSISSQFNEWWVNEKGHEPSENGGYTRGNTRNIAEFAKAKGYRSVCFVDIYDSGVYGSRGDLSTVYAFFNPKEDIKSADPVTYDDDGNVIPLSERFKSENPDIRYQKKRNRTEEDDTPKTLADLERDFFNTTPRLERRTGKAPGDKESKFYSSIQKSSIFDEAFKIEATEDNFIKNYSSITNIGTLEEAANRLDTGGEAYVLNWMQKNISHMDAVDTMVGFILLKRYQDVGDYESATAVAQKIREVGTIAGQTVQAFSIIGRFTPEMMEVYAQKDLDRALEEARKYRTAKWIQKNEKRFQLTDSEKQFIRGNIEAAAKLPEGSRDKAIKIAEINAMLQNKLPPVRGQSYKAWQRISMLLNAKTNVRNIVGNAIMTPVYIASDFFSSIADFVASKGTGVRTKSVGNIRDVKSVAKSFGKGAFESYDDFKRKIHTKQQDLDRYDIGQGKSFDEQKWGRMARAMNELDRFTSFLLEIGDRPFFEAYFTNSINNQMRANKASEPTEQMIDIATQEALQRTWQDNNGMTEAVSTIKKAMNKLSIAGYGLGDVFIKFTKTPANLTKAIYDFSPAAYISLLGKSKAFYDAVRRGDATSQMQHNLAEAFGKATAGTLLYVAAFALASAGRLTGKGDEDDDVSAYERYIQGMPDYSMKLGKWWLSYDWMQPVGAVAAVVSDYMESKDEKAGTADAVLSALRAGGDVLFNQSFMRSIQSLFATDNPLANIAYAILGDFSVPIPTVLGQFANAIDPNKRVTYDPKDPLKTEINRAKAKIPFLRNTLEVDVDIFGRDIPNSQYGFFNAFLNPANTNTNTSTKITDHVYGLYKSTKDRGVIPPQAPTSITIKGVSKKLTSEERVKYQKTMGETSAILMESLLDNELYTSLSDAEKANVLKKVYSYASALAKCEQDGFTSFEAVHSVASYITRNDYNDMSEDERQKIIRDYLMSSFEEVDNLSDESAAYYFISEKIPALVRSATTTGDGSKAKEYLKSVEKAVEDFGWSKKEADAYYKGIKSSAKTALTNYWKEFVIHAFLKGDEKRIDEIANKLYSTGLYESKTAVYRMLRGWYNESK